MTNPLGTGGCACAAAASRMGWAGCANDTIRRGATALVRSLVDRHGCGRQRTIVEDGHVAPACYQDEHRPGESRFVFVRPARSVGRGVGKTPVKASQVTQ